MLKRLLPLLTLALACGGEATDVAALGQDHEEMTWPAPYGVDFAHTNTYPRCNGDPSMFCVMAPFKAINIGLQAESFTAAERTVLHNMVAESGGILSDRIASGVNTWGAAFFDTAAPTDSVILDKGHAGTCSSSGTTLIQSSSNCVHAVCEVLGPALPDSLNGSFHICNRLRVLVDTDQVINWSHEPFSSDPALAPNLRQAVGQAVYLGAFLGTRSTSVKGRYTSDQFIRALPVNRTLSQREACMLNSYVCPGGSLGCQGSSTTVNLTATCALLPD